MIKIKYKTNNASFFACAACPRSRIQCKEKKASTRHTYRAHNTQYWKKRKTDRGEDLINEELIMDDDIANDEFNNLINEVFF